MDPVLDANGQPVQAPPGMIAVPPTQQYIADTETPEQKYARLYSAPPAMQAQPQANSAAPVQADPAPDMAAEMAAMRAEMAQLRQGQPRQVPPAAPPTRDEVRAQWVERIRVGDFDGAEAAMAEALEKRLEAKIIDRVTSQATQATNVQLEVQRHLDKVRSENPDVLRFEGYLSAPVNAAVEAARAAGKIHSPEDFVREYKSAVDNEVGKLRNIVLEYRGQGVTQARTQQTRVQQAFTPAPQQVGDHTQPSQPAAGQGESTEDYFARRNASGARLRNLG